MCVGVFDCIYPDISVLFLALIIIIIIIIIIIHRHKTNVY